MKYLSAAYFFIPLIYVNNSFLKLNNLAGVLFKSNLIKKILGVLVLFSCLPFGIHVVCYGLIFYFFCDCLISMFCIHKYVGIRIFSQIKYVRAVLFFNVIATVLLVLFESFCDNYWIAISVGIISYLFIYICYLKLLNTLEWRTIMIFINKI